MRLPRKWQPLYKFDSYLNPWMRRFSFGKLRKVLSLAPLNKGVAVDIGCGQGYFLLALSEHYTHIIGIDRDVEISTDSGKPFADKSSWKKEAHGKTLLQITRQMLDTELGRNNNVQLIRSEGIPLAENSVDACFALDVLEHVDKPHETLKEIKRILKPGGTFVFSVPNTVGKTYAIRCLLARLAGSQEDLHTSDHASFNWKEFVASIKELEVESVTGYPFWLKSISPSIIVRCRT